MHPDFWRDKKVLLTGHTGFKGSWLALWLQRRGAHVVGYALPPPTQPSLFDLARVAEGMTARCGDLTDGAALRAALDEHRPTIVLHLGAQALVRRSYTDPVGTYAANVMGTVHLLDAVRQTGGVRAVVVVTSDKCYRNQEWPWGYRETDPLGGHDPYSNSKSCAELVTEAFRRSFFQDGGTAVATARAGNVIGGGDWAADRLIPDILAAIERDQPVRVRNPNSVRPWQHVLEPLHGYLTLAERLWHDGAAYAQAWNFGPSEADARPVGWIVARLCALWGALPNWQTDAGPHPHESGYLKLDCALARAELGWAPRWNLERTLAMIVAWHQAYLAGQDVRATTLAHIAAYESEAAENAAI